MGSKNKSTSHRPRIWDNFFCKIKRAVNSVKSSDKGPPSPDNAVASIVGTAAVVAPPAQQVPGELNEKTGASSNEKAEASFDDKKDGSLKGKKDGASFDEKAGEPVKEKKKKKLGASFRLKKAKVAFYSRKFRLTSKKTEEAKKAEEASKKAEEESKKPEEVPKIEEAPKKEVEEASANDGAEASNAPKDDDHLLDEASGGEPLVPCADAESFDDDEEDEEDDEEDYEEDDDDEDDYSYGADYLMPSSSDDIDAKFAGLERREANDFIFGKLIGEGSFSTVYLAKDIHTQKQLAIKVCRKTHIIREKKVEHIKREKEILSLLSARCNPSAPFFVKLYCTFQDRTRLYFAVTYAKYGDLLSHINKVGSFDTACTRFYSAEILRALEHMHSLGIIHRDLKPENILLDERMHIKVTDFGSAKVLKLDDEGRPLPSRRRNSFVGTAQYISPDLLKDVSECSRSSDLWAFGAIVYQMVAGLPPFRSNSEYLIFKQIKNVDYDFPDGFCSCAKDLVKKILVADPMKRLGARDGQTYDSIRAHEFYEGLEFETLYKQEPPHIYPYLPGTSQHAEMRSHYKVPDNLEPGLDDRQITRLLGLELQGTSPPRPAPREPPVEKTRKKSGSGLGLKSLSPQDIEVRLSEQRLNARHWHNLCDGNLIVKQGLIDKRKGLFARRRMLMLTLGPHLYYADPVSMVLKGEIPWSEELRVEPKNFKIFFVHTPNRTYYLEDPEGYALEWCKAIEEVRVHTYGPQDPPKRDQDRRT